MNTHKGNKIDSLSCPVIVLQKRITWCYSLLTTGNRINRSLPISFRRREQGQGECLQNLLPRNFIAKEQGLYSHQPGAFQVKRGGGGGEKEVKNICPFSFTLLLINFKGVKCRSKTESPPLPPQPCWRPWRLHLGSHPPAIHPFVSVIRTTTSCSVHGCLCVETPIMEERAYIEGSTQFKEELPDSYTLTVHFRLVNREY